MLAFKCPGLLRYTAYRCKQLSDTSIIAVASQCPLLQKVHVGNQDRLTDEGLKQVTLHFNRNKFVDAKLNGFSNVMLSSRFGLVLLAK